MNASGGPNCRGLPNVPTKQYGGSWYHTPFLVTDNAYVPYQPEYRVAVRRAVDAAVPVQRRLRANGTTTDGARPRRCLKVGDLHGGRCVGGRRPGGRLRPVPIRLRTASYHANFTDASRLKAGQDVRIAGVTVGKVKDVRLQPRQHRRRRLQCQQALPAVHLDEGGGPLPKPHRRPLPGDHRPDRANCASCHQGHHPASSHTEPALDLDALLGGLQPVLKGLDGDKINEVSNAVIELLQGQGGALSTCCPTPAHSPRTWLPVTNSSATSSHNLNTVLGTVDDKGAQFNASVDQLQKLVTGLAQGPRPDRRRRSPRWRRPRTTSPTCCRSRGRPLQGVIENIRPLATAARRPQGRRQQGHRTAGRELLAAQRPWRLRLVLQHLLLLDPDKDQRTSRQRHPDSVRWASRPVEGQVSRTMARPDGRQSAAHRDLRHLRWWHAWCWCRSATRQLPFWPQGKSLPGVLHRCGGISPGNDVDVSGIRVGKVDPHRIGRQRRPRSTFTVNRDIRVGDQSLVAIKTDTVLGQKSLAVTPLAAALMSRR